MEDDSQLVRHSLAGKQEAFGEIYDRYARLVRAICFEQTRNLDDSHELCQEVFVRAWMNLASLENTERLGQWLTGIARLACMEWVRGQKRNRRGLKELVQRSDATVSPTDQSPDQLGLLFESLQSLSEQERLALHLFYLNEQSADQARSVLGLSASGFYKLLERARTRLLELVNAFEKAGK